MTNEKATIVICLAVSTFLSMCGSRPVLAQEESAGKPHAAAPQASGPVDITADEQEFANDSVIARGRVRVVYKDSVILSPLATLYKDETGNPNRAVFTGHPRLTQGRNKMDANILTFEVQKQKVVAVGNAHSEVEIPEDQKQDGLTAGKQSDSKLPPPPPVQDKTAKVDKPDSDDDDEKPATAPQTSGNANASAKPADGKPKQAERIITDSERQEFDQDSGRFEATGHVRLVNGDMIVFSDKMQVVYSATSNKPETCLFSGHVIATQGKNSTCADNISYSLSTRRLQATGNVKSKVIQDKNGEGKKKVSENVGVPTARADWLCAPANAAARKTAAASSTSIVAPVDGAGDKPVWVFSDAQDYSRDNGRVAAHGNVKVVSGDMYGCGPSIVMTRKADGKADKVYFIGRSQISQPGRRWVADEITYLVDEKKVIANGNATAMVQQGADSKQPKRKTITAPAPGPSRLAEDPNKRSLSARKNEPI
jgi:lipopolysaccharide export system protein LptA